MPREATSLLLEREREVALIDATLDAALAGRGGGVLLEAGAGLGKSRLVAVAREHADARGVRTLAARGSELERGFGFGTIRALLGPAVSRAQDAEREQLLEGAAGLARATLDPVGDDVVGEDAAFHGLHWLVVALSERRPLLLVVDDLHWVDEVSLRFLHYLLGRVDDLPVAVLLAGRPAGDVGGAGLTDRLAAHARVTRLDLAPLSAPAGAEVLRVTLGPAADPRLCSAAASATAGNPFLLMELALGLRDQPDVPDPDELLRRVAPEGVARGVAARLAQLGSEAVTVARVLAVLGDGVDAGTVAAVAGLDAAPARAALDALAAAGVLAGGPEIAFRHPLVAEAVDRLVPVGARATLNERAAAVLAAAEADPERVARHLVAAPPADDPNRIQALRAGASLALRRGAPQTAVAVLQRALAEPPAEADRPGVLGDLAVAEARARLPAAADHAREALEAVTDPDDRARAAVRLGFALLDAGRPPDAVATCDAGWSPELARDVAFELEACRAAARGLDQGTAPPEDLEALMTRAVRGIATPAERLVLAHGAMGGALAGTPVAAVRRLATAAVGPAGRVSLEVHAIVAVAYGALALAVCDELDAAERALVPLIDLARERGSVRAVAAASTARAQARLRAGDLLNAIGDAHAARAALEFDWDLAMASAIAVEAQAQLERGDVHAAIAALDVPGAEARWADTFAWHDWLLAEGRLALVRGDARTALLRFEALGDRLEALNASHPAVVPWRAGAAQACVALGDAERASALAAEVVERARAFGARRAIGHALRILAEVGPQSRRVELLHEATAVLAASPAALERAHAQAMLGEALHAAGDADGARAQLREALDGASRCGARPLAERARTTLVTLGDRPRRPTLRGRDALTPAELRTAELAAGGATNREIAQSQFVTVKTVETHLRNAFAKLGVERRRELVDALGDARGLA